MRVIIVIVVASLVMFMVGLAAHQASSGALTELEKTKVELVAVKTQLVELSKRNADLQAAYGQCQAQLGPLQQRDNATAVAGEAERVKAEIEKAHPGMTFDPATGQLVPAAKPVAPVPPPSGGRGGGV